MSDTKRGRKVVPDLTELEPTVVDESVGGLRRTADWTDVDEVQLTPDWTRKGAGPPPTGDGVRETADWSNIYAEQTPGGDGIRETADWTHLEGPAPPTGDGIGETADWSNIAAEQTPGGDGIGRTADWTSHDTEVRPRRPDQLGGSGSPDETRPAGRPVWKDLLD